MMQMMWGLLRSKNSLVTGVVSIIVVGYISFLLGSNYLSQKALQESALERVRQDTEKQAMAIHHFFEECKLDLQNLVKHRTLAVFFENKALGMSMKYGLEDSLLAIVDQLQQFLTEKTLGTNSIYSRVMFIDTDGELLVDLGENAATPKTQGGWQAFLAQEHQEAMILTECDQRGLKIFVSISYFFKDQYAGQILAWIIPDRVMKYFISSGTSANQVSGLVCPQGHIHTTEQPSFSGLPDLVTLDMGTPQRVEVRDAEGATVKMFAIQLPIDDTPFSLFTLVSRSKVLGTASPGSLLVAMASFAMIVLGGIAKVLQMNTRHNIILQTRLEETRQREQDIDAKNLALQQEIAERQKVKEALRYTITEIISGAKQIASIKTELSVRTSENSQIAQEVQMSVEAMMTRIRELVTSVEEVADGVSVLTSSVEETATSITQMTPSIRNIVSNTAELTHQTDETATFLLDTVEALEHIVDTMNMSTHVSQVTMQDALKGQEAMQHVTISMETLHETITMAVEEITGFSQRSQEIGTILDVIREIADQTSLLALNASIIAAQAGNHGRGFAVVAGEMKSLATGVSASTKDITEIVRALQRNTTHVVQTVHAGVKHVEQGMARTRQAREALHNIMTSAQRSSAVVTEASDALSGLMTNTQSVAAAMKQVKAMTDEIHLATNEQETSTVQINQAIAQMNEMTSHIWHVTTSQTAWLHQVLEATTDVTTLIDRNFESSHQMNLAVKGLESQADHFMQTVDRFQPDP